MLFSNIIKKKFDAVLGRYDGDPAIFYFSGNDFPAINRIQFDIKGSQGILRGYFYFCDELDFDRVVIFDHGIGAGHMAYMKEIEFLTKNGYTVYSYDHTGCVESDGDGILGFSQGINDLDRVVRTLKLDPRLSRKPIKIIGHSWGAYSAMNAVALHPQITHVVSLAGFLSAKALIEQYLPKFVMRYSSEVMGRERQLNPLYADMDARESLVNSGAKFLHLQSEDDTKVKYELCTPILEEALKNRKNTEFITLNNKNHDPQRSEEAVEADKRMQAELINLRKENRLNSEEEIMEFQKKHNWDLIYRQDPEVWKKILDFLES